MEFKITVVTESKKENIKDLCLEALSDLLAKDGEYYAVERVNDDDFVARMIAEKDELRTRLNKLEDFINGNNKFKELTGREQYLLQYQCNAMILYLHFLSQRVDLYNHPKMSETAKDNNNG